MSFLNFDPETQKVDGYPFENDSVESKTSLIITKASNLLTDFADGVGGLARLINQIGTKRDSTQLRQTIEEAKLPELNEYKLQLEHLTNDISHLISDNNGVSSADKFSEEKVRREFENVTKRFSLLKRQYNEKKSSVILSNRISNKQALNDESSLASKADESTPLIQQQQQQQNYSISQQEVDLHALLAEERACEIKKIHGGVEEINSIYKQLGHLVQQQGAQIDTVENNLSNFSTNAQRASSELAKADSYQKKKGKWTCILLLVLVVVFLIIVLAVFA